MEHLSRIEERMRCLQAVVFRSRQRQMWRLTHAPIRITNYDGELVTVADLQAEEDRVHRELGGFDVVGGEMVVTGNKRKASYLVAKALGVETHQGEGFATNLFHCNVCMDRARDPVLTCCGHLFCWPCFHKLSCDDYSNVRECPVCRGDVNEAGIIPIYGNANVDDSSSRFSSDETSSTVPARPRPQRIESIRQRFRY